MFERGFPFVCDEVIRSALSHIPQKNYNNITQRTIGGMDIVFFIGETQISFPYRLYSLEIENSVLSKLDYTERLILHCIYTRSFNGYVRERHIKSLLAEDFPDWCIPYIIKVCDEYVIEIVQTVYDNLKNKDTDRFKKVCIENWDLFCKSYNRMISYWNEFYRAPCYRYKDYIGRKLFIECFGANRKMKCKTKKTPWKS